MLSSVKRPSQVQRDYERIIRGIGTPAPIPKPRGKSLGEGKGEKEKDDQTVFWFENQQKKMMNCPINCKPLEKILKPKLPHIRRIWPKNRPAPMRC